MKTSRYNEIQFEIACWVGTPVYVSSDDAKALCISGVESQDADPLAAILENHSMLASVELRDNIIGDQGLSAQGSRLPPVASFWPFDGAF